MQNDIKIYKNENEECDECLTKGICSVSPGLSALHSVILLHLKELAFYVLRLKELGGVNNKLKEVILDALAGILVNAEYTQAQFHKIITELDEDIEQTKTLYRNFCQEHNIEAQSLKLYFKHGKDFSISEATKKGEKYSLKKSTTLSDVQKNLYDIMLFLIKSICIKMIELKRLGKENDDNYYAILSMLNTMNLAVFSEEKTKIEIGNFIDVYYKLIADVFYTQAEKYGEIGPTEVSFSTVPGKAILVSGSDYKKLESVLNATLNTKISVYTHGAEMLLAHAHPKLKAHPNLKGHFGSGTDTSLIDFAEFPGPILMTKLTLHSTISLYRGRLFTLDSIAPHGIIKIQEDNYKPLIDSALNSPGFVHGREKPSLKVGYSDAEIHSKIDELLDKIAEKKIRHLFIIGTFNHPNSCPKYFETFFKNLPKDCYALSLSCNEKMENVFHLDSFYDYSFLFKAIKYMKDKVDIFKLPISTFVTKCDKHTIAALLYLKQVGIRHVYVCKCPSTLINPALMKTLQEYYEIKEFSTPKADIETALKEE